MIPIPRPIAALAALGLAVGVPTPLACQGVAQASLQHRYQVTTVVEGLVNPWSMAFLPGGDLLVTERPGRLRIVRNGKLLPDPVPGVPVVFARGQGGLLDIALHPNFATNHLIYLSYAKPTMDSGGSTTAVARARFENDRLTDLTDIFVAETRRRGHYGSRLAFDRAGFLYVTVGDRQAPPSGNLEAHPAQDISNHHGTINRLHDDGRVPADNPFVDRAGARPEIWSYGHRNLQGLMIHPETGELWATEHGPQGGDELNLIQKGHNYGWPVVGYGVNYGAGAPIHATTSREGMDQPVHFWVPSIATTAVMVYTGDRFPGWRGSIFVGGMAGQQLARLTLDGHQVVNEETLVRGRGRIRDVKQGPDGFIYLAIDGTVPTPILRLEPVGR
ncbi:MAG: PQQ-dependent sugar dehydrogenase [Gemmatimonadota bacterium]